MNLKMMNEAFKRKYSTTLNEAIDESTKAQLRKNLILRYYSEIENGCTIKDLEIAFQSVIEEMFPDHSWWEITDCNIFMELFNIVQTGETYRLSEVCSMIVDQLKPEFSSEPTTTEVVDEAMMMPPGKKVKIATNKKDEELWYQKGLGYSIVSSNNVSLGGRDDDMDPEEAKKRFENGEDIREHLQKDAVVNESFEHWATSKLREHLFRLNEAEMSDEDKHDSALIKGMIDKIEKRSNARFTPEEQGMMQKYGITRDNWAKRLGVGDRELNPSYDGKERKVYNGYDDWKGHYVRNGDPSKINYADRARKLKDRQFSGDTQVSSRYTPNGAINAHTQQGGHTLQDVERAAVEDRDKKPIDDMQRHLWDRKYHQDQIDGAQAEYDKSIGDARKKYDDSVRYATDTYRRHTVDAEQSRKRAQDRIDQMLKRK